MIQLRRNTTLVRVGSNGANLLPAASPNSPEGLKSAQHSLAFDLFLAVLFGGAFALGATLVGKVIK